MSAALLKSLKKHWGFDSFRTPQEEIITSVLNGQDTVALLPTGGGKSLCFQLPSLHLDGICLVISPLIALMKDQVNTLSNKGIKAVALTSFLSQDELIRVFDNLKFGDYKFLYVSPERLQSKFIQQKIAELKLSLIAVDEAHCISEWGHDFRPSYLKINILKTLHPNTPIIALTGSATKKVLKDITTQLELNNPAIFRKSLYRKNLAYQVYETENKLALLERILTKTKGTIIIYENTRRNTIETSNQLNVLGYKSGYYHGGMTANDKSNSYDNWMQEKVPIMVATSAFGMGIDKSNVKAVIHLHLPSSIENLVQESGRAGRDGQKAFAILIKNNHDITQLNSLLNYSIVSIEQVKEIYFKLNQFFNIGYGELNTEILHFSFNEFCERYNLRPNLVFNCLKELEHESILVFDESTRRKSSVKFLADNTTVLRYNLNNQIKAEIIKAMLRSYPGIFDLYKDIDEAQLSKITSLGYSVIKANLKQLHNEGLIDYKENLNTNLLQFIKPREDDHTINVISKNITKRNETKVKKRNDLIQFVEVKDSCRYKSLLSYFDETLENDCGSCDVCLAKKKPTTNYNELRNLILQLLQEGNRTSQQLATELDYTDEDILFCLKLLLDKDLISVNSQNKYIAH